jgi:uncharacterized protein YdaU (DUF1376 family)
MPKKIDIWMPLYIGDYLSATEHLQTPEHGAFLLLLFHQWRTGRPLPGDLAALVQITKARRFFIDASSIPLACLEHVASIKRASTSEDEKVTQAWVLNLMQQFFFLRESGEWSNARGDRERAEWEKRQKTFEKRARTAANARWKDHNTERESSDFKGDASSIARGRARKKLMQSPSPSPVEQSTLTAPPPRSSGVGRGARRAPTLASHPNSENAAKTKGTALQAIATPGDRGKGVLHGMRGGKAARIAENRTSRAFEDGDKPESRSDPRFGPFRGEIFRAYESMYKVGVVRRSRPSWGPREGSALNMLLASSPDVDFPLFKAALVNWSKSEVNVAADPHKWISEVMSYLNEPLDRFGDPLRVKKRQ